MSSEVIKGRWPGHPFCLAHEVAVTAAVTQWWMGRHS
jgi:hypothetical protein